MDERMRDMRGMDGRRLPPRNSRGEFMSRGRGRGRGRRGDRGMDYGMYPDMPRGDGRVIRSYPTMHPQGADYGLNYDMARGQDMRSMDYRGGDYRGGQMSDRGGDYGDMRRGDGHHYPEQMGGQTYYPIEAMGRFNGYWGMPQGDYGYPDMRGRRDYGDYGYGDYGDYGESLSNEELHKWQKKLMEQLDEREKQMFRKEVIIPKFKQMGIEMKDFNEEELYTLTLAKYLDHKQSIGQNPDLAIKLAKDALCDQDAKYSGSKWLCVYFDTFVDD